MASTLSYLNSVQDISVSDFLLISHRKNPSLKINVIIQENFSRNVENLSNFFSALFVICIFKTSEGSNFLFLKRFISITFDMVEK